jgi:hypothetical protein
VHKKTRSDAGFFVGRYFILERQSVFL